MGMNEKRPLRAEERTLIEYLLTQLGLSLGDYPIADMVVEYEGGVMGSISMCDEGADNYAGDLIQVEYTDVDGVPVIITLTKDNNNQLLDLDFWKEDFSKLISYPKPEQVSIKKG